MTSPKQQSLQSDRFSGCALAVPGHSNELIGTRNATKQPVHLTGPLYSTYHADIRAVDLRNHVGNKELLKPESIRKFRFVAVYSHFRVPHPHGRIVATRWHSTQACGRGASELTQVKHRKTTGDLPLANQERGSAAR